MPLFCGVGEFFIRGLFHNFHTLWSLNLRCNLAIGRFAVRDLYHAIRGWECTLYPLQIAQVRCDAYLLAAWLQHLHNQAVGPDAQPWQKLWR